MLISLEIVRLLGHNLLPSSHFQPKERVLSSPPLLMALSVILDCVFIFTGFEALGKMTDECV